MSYPDPNSDSAVERWDAERVRKGWTTAPKPNAATVKRATLFDGVIDTYSTESELNGYKPTQGRMI